MLYKERKQNRLKGFDYSSSGYYFVTICTENREQIFGSILHNNSVGVGRDRPEMVLNEYGVIVQDVWRSLSDRYPITLDVFQIMPNHFHGIVILNYTVGAGSSRPKLGNIIAYLKYESSKRINNIRGPEDPAPTHTNTIKKIWQRSFYDHIIRDERSLFAIRQYIKDNPANWDQDEENL